MIEEWFIGSGEELVFVDETSKNDHTCARRYGYAQVSDRAQFKDVFVRGDRYSLVAALAKDGYIAACAVPGSYDSEEFYSFIVEEVVSHLPSISRSSLLHVGRSSRKWAVGRLSLEASSSWTTAASITTMLLQKQYVMQVCQASCFARIYAELRPGCLLLYLPSYSPDLNPIEESFSTRMHPMPVSGPSCADHCAVKAWIRRHGTAMCAAEDPIAALLDACGCITADMAAHWFLHAGYIKPEYL